MKPFRIAVLLSGGLLFLDAGSRPLQAAWNNVFQVACHHRPAVSYYAPSACCPQPVCCQTQYVQRSFYQPVTTFQTRTYFEPVTSYRTSYFYEPVQSYRYSCYFDPCTCSYQQVAIPTTSFRLRAQCCPVTSWVQRCMTVPVTTQQLAHYWEPVTTCTSAGAPIPATPAPALAAPPPSSGPGVSEGRIPPTPGVLEQPGRPNGSSFERSPDPSARPGSGNLQRSSPPPPTVRLDKIVAAPPGNVEGQVFRGDSAPQAGARLLFVSTARQGVRQTATADTTGQFRVTLGGGEWLVYLHAADGRPVFHSKLELRENEPRKVTLVSR